MSRSGPGDGLRISIVIATLGGGGAERLAVELSARLTDRGHTVTLTTFTRQITEAYEVSERVDRDCAEIFYASGLIGSVAAYLRRRTTIRRTLVRQAPDAILSFIDVTNVRVLGAMRRSVVPVVVSEETDPAVLRPSITWRIRRRWVYRKAARLVVHAEGFRRWAEQLVHDPDRVVVIPNAPWIERTLAPTSQGRAQTVMALGRLHHVKGFDVLVRAFALAARANPEWKLVIYGDGDERTQLESLVAEHDLTARVHLPGRTADPSRVYAAATIFVLPSRTESFPLALVEAMDAALPIVASDLSTGPGEILTDGVDGLLVPPDDPAALARALDRLMGDPELRSALGTAAQARAADYSPDHVVGIWDELVRAVAAPAGS